MSLSVNNQINESATSKNNAALNAIDKVKPRQWLAQLTLDFSHNDYGTQLSRTTRQGPLSVQKAFYPEGQECAHIYLLHPPAGIVSGDELHVELNIADNGHVLVTTPGANRFYRAREDAAIGISKQKQVTTVHADTEATCENFPQETIVYQGADGVNQVDIHLTKSSVYLGWDITCLGLPSSKEPFDSGKYSQVNRLFCDDKLIYHDRIALDQENQLLQHPAGLNGHSVFGTFLVCGHNKMHDVNKRAQYIEALRELIENAQASSKVSITDIDGLFVIRYLGEQAHECKSLFIMLWQYLRPELTPYQGIEPRIWHT